MTILIELGILLVFLILTLTQIIFPLFGWKRFFWMFRDPEKRLNKIESEIEEIKLNKTVKAQEEFKQTMETEGEIKNGTTTKEGETNVNKENNLG
jgi:hypothetical protein